MYFKAKSLHRMVQVTKRRMKFRQKRSFLHSDVTATRKCTAAATCILAVASTYSNLTILTLCGEARHCITECIILDELVNFVVYMINVDQFNCKNCQHS